MPNWNEFRGQSYCAKSFCFSEEEQKRKEEEELLRLEEMDEEEYDALSDSEKARTDEKRLVIKKARIKKLVKKFCGG